MAGEVLRTTPGPSGLVDLPAEDGIVKLSVDVQRLRAAIATRRSLLVTMPSRRRAGRKPKRQANPVTVASRYGLDVTLLQANLGRGHAERLRQLDGMAAFSKNVRRKS